MADKYFATATVQVTLEITVKDTWGKDCPISQVYRQGAESAIGSLGYALRQSGIKAKIIGTPQVSAVVAKGFE
jgi:hypothetical protein